MSTKRKQYVVVGPCAYFTAHGATGTFRQLFYRDAPVPAGATDEEIAHCLETGLIAEVDDVAVVEPDGGGHVVLEEPARNASKDDWVAFAITKGATAEDAEALKRDELVELYATPAQS